ncbi:MAG: NAD(P)-dependent oxidoreductase, partial [Bacteroidota bacterium]
MKQVLITDGVHPILIKELEAAGYTCDYHPKISLEEVRQRIGPYEGLIINSKILVDRTLLDAAPRLQFVGRLGSGMEIVDQVYAKEKGVHVLRAPEGNRNAVAEHALGMLLALANKLRTADAEVRQMIWQREQNRGFEIMGKTVGIIGFGHTGRSFAEKLAGMGVKVLAYDKYKKHFAQDLPYVLETGMESIFMEADIISLHLPLAKETRHWVDQQFIQKCQKKVVLINTSRGSVIKTTDLVDALRKEQILGACLDVFENEKPLTFQEEEQGLYQQLYEMDQVLLTPHVAGWTVESKKRLAVVLSA